MMSNELPLEILLKHSSDDRANFPTPENHYEKYTEILKQLRKDVYPNVNTGLAASSEETGIYTDHSAEHFDEVVLHAGIILGLENNELAKSKANEVSSKRWVLEPYELYVLLLSIRLHDVGNIYGRENHENNIRKVIKDNNLVHLNNDDIEAKMICRIAGAHGGETPTGNKDTIGQLLEQSHGIAQISNIDYRKIAALTRIADEVCENRQRARFARGMNIPEKNKIYHEYASGIVSNAIKSNVLYLRFEYSISQIKKSYCLDPSKPDKYKSLIEEIRYRLRKAEMERRYCNRFIPESAKISQIHVLIDVVAEEMDEESFHLEVIKTVTFTLKEEGYPLRPDQLFDRKTENFFEYFEASENE